MCKVKQSISGSLNCLFMISWVPAIDLEICWCFLVAVFSVSDYALVVVTGCSGVGTCSGWSCHNPVVCHLESIVGCLGPDGFCSCFCVLSRHCKVDTELREAASQVKALNRCNIPASSNSLYFLFGSGIDSLMFNSFSDLPPWLERCAYDIPMDEQDLNVRFVFSVYIDW